MHLAAASTRWRWRDWFTKRVTGWINLRCLGRGKRFLLAARVLEALREEALAVPVDHYVFSGDATALGFETEIAQAALALGVGKSGQPPGLAVPGNHDYYTPDLEASGSFERHFAPWLAGQRVDGATYPFAQAVGPLWLVGVNSCRGHRLPWDASGWVGPEQRARLARLLRELPPGPRVLVTHYPVYQSSGDLEPGHRGLRDLAAVLDVARASRVCLWLHGHNHRPYHLQQPRDVPFPVICAGSATQEGRWSYGHYTIEGSRLHAVRRAYDPARAGFFVAETFELELPI